VLDTCTYIDLDTLDPSALPAVPEITAITMAELHQGVAMAKDIATRAVRTELLGMAIVEFDPLPFDRDAASRYGTLVAMTVAANRDPRPRRLDLMIAAIASSRGLPLFTRNADDFSHLDDTVDVVVV
jgi:predicted nucleic acid-binding protein